MKEIYSKYKERLINISSRNRSLVMKKIYKKRAFDLYRLISDVESVSCEDLRNFITSRSKDNYMLLDDPYKVRIEELNKLEKEINEQFENELKILENISNQKEEYDKKVLVLETKYKDKLESEIVKVEREIERLIDYSTSLTYLDREIKAIEKETGRYELYVGYPFVEGVFQDNTFVRAPLLLFPIRIEKENNQWFLSHLLEDDILINKVFVFGFSKYNETKINEFETEFSSLDNFEGDTITSILKYLYNNKITIQDTKIREIEKFVDYTDKNIPNYKLGELVSKNYLVIGQFPISNSIYNDYQELEKNNLDNKLIKKLLVNQEESRIDKYEDNESEDKLKLAEKDLFFISSLDYSQEKAVATTNQTDQLVIYGPPGTGKSQTIANIISDSLAKGKRVLMVSQKRVALDVIYNRLSSLNTKAILIHDANKDKKSFYEKISNAIEDSLNNSISNPQYDINVKATKIDSGIKALERIATYLHTSRGFGLNLQQMYSKSKNINTKEDRRFDKFKSCRLDKKLSSYTYQQLNEGIQTINNDVLINNYFTNKEMLAKNNILEDILPNFDYIEAQEIYDKIQSLVNDAMELYNLSIGNDRIKQLLGLYLAENYIVNEERLLKYIDEKNYSENKFLLDKLNNGKWWSISYWINYKKNSEKELLNEKEFEARKHALLEEVFKDDKRIKQSIEKLTVLKAVITDNLYNSLLNRIFNGECIEEMLVKISEGIEKYEQFKETKFMINTLNKIEHEVMDYIFNHSANRNEFNELLNDTLEYEILARIMELEKAPEITQALADHARFGETVNSINQLMAEKNKLIPALILNNWQKSFAESMNNSLFREFKRQANKKRALLPIRRFVHEFETYILKTFPCWLLSPETVSDILPLKEGMFDVIIFDEASQIFVENAIPTIYRGKQVVIAGDDQQLRPSSLFRVKFDDNEEEEIDMQMAAAFEEESLLDLAKTSYDSVHLNYHYRSAYDQLINFSNYAFYKGGLQVSPNISSSSSKYRAISRLKVNGRWIDRKNIAEAEKVVDLVADIFKKRKRNQTIGIITFNINQKDLIEDLLEKRAYADPLFKSVYATEIDRKEGNEDVSLFVKNIENVQGNERDIIIFSIGYAANENGKVSVNFGSLSQDGGENRLNVAISRAKSKVYLVTSIEPEALDIDGTKNRGPKLFKKYLQYAREVSDGNEEAANAILKSLLDTDIERSKEDHYDSDFEMEVRDAFVDLGYDIKTQVGVSGYKIDLAIYDSVTSRYVLGIECDGATYHSSKSARERDIHRQRYLESRGWKIVRIWSRDWWRNPNGEIKKIDELAKMYLKEHQSRANETTEEIKSVTDYIEKTKTILKADKINEPKENYKGSQTRISTISLGKKDVVWYGDIVLIKDISSQDTFEVELERNPHNRHLMKEIELKLLGQNLNQRLSYSGFEYEILKISKQIV